MARIILFNKPFQVLSQFSDKDGRATLAKYFRAPEYRVAGRLDYDSEGLLVLTDDGALQQRIANPRHKLWKTYLVQVEGEPSADDLQRLREGVDLRDGRTLPARARAVPPPDLWPRVPPIRERRSIPDSWLQLAIREGRNRQVRRMTAAIGFPTLRLVRTQVGDWALGDLASGATREQEVHLPHSSPPGRNKRRR